MHKHRAVTMPKGSKTPRFRSP